MGAVGMVGGASRTGDDGSGEVKVWETLTS